MQLIAILTGSFVIAFSGAMMPGPLLTVAVADSTKRGFISGPLLILGHSILELILVIAILAGAGSFLQLFFVKIILFILGAIVLLVMSFLMIRSAPDLSLKFEPDKNNIVKYPIIAGILASISNPYWIIWWVTIGLGYLVTAEKAGVYGVAAFFIGHISADFVWYSLVTFTVSRGRTLMNDILYRNTIRVCAAFLAFFGIWFFCSAVVLVVKV